MSNTILDALKSQQKQMISFILLNEKSQRKIETIECYWNKPGTYWPLWSKDLKTINQFKWKSDLELSLISELVIDQIMRLLIDITRHENFDLTCDLIYYLFVKSSLIKFQPCEPDIY